MGRNDPTQARERLDTPLTRLTEALLRARTDIRTIYPADPTPRNWAKRTSLSFFPGPDFPDYVDDRCIYDGLDDATARWVLEDFVDRNSTVCYGIARELSKLLSTRGVLVRDRMEPIIRGIIDAAPGYRHYFLHLGYAATMPDGESVVLTLLDIVGSDSRDGLFLPCYKLNTRAIYEKVTAKVREWDSDENDVWYAGTGEPWMIRRMIEKWDDTFGPEGHADVRRIVDKHLQRVANAAENQV